MSRPWMRNTPQLFYLCLHRVRVWTKKYKPANLWTNSYIFADSEIFGSHYVITVQF